jgi:hypothetical protein
MIGLSLRALALWLLPWVAVFVQATPDADNYNLTIQPAWDGFIKPEVTSELSVRLLADSGGRASVYVQGSLLHASADSEFEPGIPLVMYLPVAHDSIAPVKVEVYVDGQSTIRKAVLLHVLPAAAKIMAVATENIPQNWPESITRQSDATVLYTAAKDLPRTGQAYDLLSALILSGSALRAMDSLQRDALTDYTGACGVLYLAEISASTASTLRKQAGCSGRNVITLPAEAVDSSKPVNVSPLPAAAFLGQLVPGGHSAALRSLAAFLSAYVVLLILVARSRVSALPLVAVPPIATVLAVLGWSLGNPVTQIVSWAEMHSGDPVVRFSGLVQVIGTSRRVNSLALPLQLGLPLAEKTMHATELHISYATAHYDLRLYTHLMSLHEFFIKGFSPSPFIDVSSHAGTVRVVNRGDTPSSSGLLAWRGKRYSVPGLAAGHEWQKPDLSEPWGGSPQEQLLRQRAIGGGIWMLLPFHIPALQSLADQYEDNSWLLVEGNGDA